MSTDKKAKRQIYIRETVWKFLSAINQRERATFIEHSVVMRMTYKYHVYSAFCVPTGRTFFNAVQDAQGLNVSELGLNDYMKERPDILSRYSIGDHVFSSHGVFGTWDEAVAYKYYLMNKYLDEGGILENIDIGNGRSQRTLIVELPYNIAQAVVKLCVRRDIFVSKYVLGLIKRHLTGLKKPPVKQDNTNKGSL